MVQQVRPIKYQDEEENACPVIYNIMQGQDLYSSGLYWEWKYHSRLTSSPYSFILTKLSSAIRISVNTDSMA